MSGYAAMAAVIVAEPALSVPILRLSILRSMEPGLAGLHVGLTAFGLAFFAAPVSVATSCSVPSAASWSHA